MSLSSLVRPCALISVCLFMASCGDKPELVVQREKQRAELKQLNAELDTLHSRIEALPKDRSTELAKLKEETESNKNAIASLDEEISGLERKKKDLEKQQEAYQRKYQLR